LALIVGNALINVENKYLAEAYVTFPEERAAKINQVVIKAKGTKTE
jgi:hypothetical protein